MGDGGTVHVAVEKTMALFQWTCMGKLPASRANPEMLEAFRHEEREETMRVLSTYLMVCSRSRVKASIATTETDEVQKGIVNLVNLHLIRKLVVGSTPDFMKGKRTSCMASHVAEHAPNYCGTWFVNKRKLVWTRPASASSSMRLPSCQLATPFTRDLIMPWSFIPCQNEFIKTTRDPLNSHSASSSGNNSFGGDEYVAPRVPSFSSAKSMEECLLIQLAELKREVDESKDEAHLRLIGSKMLEDEATEAFYKVIEMSLYFDFLSFVL